MNHEGTKDTKTMLAFSQSFFWLLYGSIALLLIKWAVLLFCVAVTVRWAWRRSRRRKVARYDASRRGVIEDSEGIRAVWFQRVGENDGCRY